MSHADKELVRRGFHAFESGIEPFDEIYSSDYVLHDPAEAEDVRGLEGMEEFSARTRTAYPDVRFTIDHQFADAEFVATRWTVTGTNQGEVNGMAPTGKHATITGITISRVAGGRIAEEWTNYDALGLMQQLGLLPPPAPA